MSLYYRNIKPLGFEGWGFSGPKPRSNGIVASKRLKKEGKKDRNHVNFKFKFNPGGLVARVSYFSGLLKLVNS